MVQFEQPCLRALEHADYFHFKRQTDMFSQYAQHTGEAPVDACGICRLPVDPDHVLRCRLCQRSSHRLCVKPRDADEQWHCRDCADGPIHIFTCWIALGDIGVDNSTLAFVPGTHRCTGFADVPAKHQVPSSFLGQKNPTFFIAQDGLRPGDVFLFNIETVHCASKNTGERFRPSIDTRLMLTQQGRELCKKYTT
jgi:hypothetical protein